MVRVRGKKGRFAETQIRRSPRLQRVLPLPENRFSALRKTKRGRPAARSKLNQKGSVGAPEEEAPARKCPINKTGERDEEEKARDERREGSVGKTKTEEGEEGEEGEAPKEDKVTSSTELKGPWQFQHPKYEGCMWIKGSLAPPYSGIRRWKSLDDAEIEPLLDNYEKQLCEWAAEYAVETGDMVDDSLSDGAKQAIMDSLGSYCAFRDWDSLVEGLSLKKDTPEVSMPNSPHTPMESHDIEQESPDNQPENSADPPSTSAPDAPMDTASDIKAYNAADETKQDGPDEPMENTPEAQMEGPTDAQPDDTSNPPLENPSEDTTQNSSDGPPSNPPNTPRSSSPEVPIVNSPSPLPPNIPKEKSITPPYFPTLLVECLVSKCLYENIVQNPFYYLVKTEDEELDSVPTAFGKDFYNIWQRLMRASRVKAQRVRMEMTQLLNGFDLWDQCHDISIGAQSRTLRRQAAEHLATSFLDRSSALHPLLRPLNDPKQTTTRLKRLIHILREAAEIAIWMYTQESYFLFVGDVAQLGPFDGQITGREECLELGFKEVEDTMRPHGVTRADYPDGVLNGRCPVLLTRPVVRRVFVDSWTSCALNDRPGKVVSRAVVLLGREEPLDKNRTKW